MYRDFAEFWYDGLEPKTLHKILYKFAVVLSLNDMLV